MSFPSLFALNHRVSRISWSIFYTCIQFTNLRFAINTWLSLQLQKEVVMCGNPFNTKAKLLCVLCTNQILHSKINQWHNWESCKKYQRPLCLLWKEMQRKDHLPHWHSARAPKGTAVEHAYFNQPVWVQQCQQLVLTSQNSPWTQWFTSTIMQHCFSVLYACFKKWLSLLDWFREQSFLRKNIV